MACRTEIERRGHRYQRKPRHAADDGGISLTDDWERGTFWGGIIFAVSFGLMFLYAGVAF